MTRIIALCLMLCATPAWAANGWFTRSDCTGGVPGSLNSYPVYFCADSAATLNSFSKVLATFGKRLEVSRIGDSTQSGAGACEVTIYETPAISGSTVSVSTGLSLISGDTTGDGIQDDLSLNGAVNRRALRGFQAVGITLQLTVIPTGSQQCVIAVFGA